MFGVCQTATVHFELQMQCSYLNLLHDRAMPNNTTMSYSQVELSSQMRHIWKQRNGWIQQEHPRISPVLPMIPVVGQKIQPRLKPLISEWCPSCHQVSPVWSRWILVDSKVVWDSTNGQLEENMENNHFQLQALYQTAASWALDVLRMHRRSTNELMKDEDHFSADLCGFRWRAWIPGGPVNPQRLDYWWPMITPHINDPFGWLHRFSSSRLFRLLHEDVRLQEHQGNEAMKRVVPKPAMSIRCHPQIGQLIATVLGFVRNSDSTQTGQYTFT